MARNRRPASTVIAARRTSRFAGVLKYVRPFARKSRASIEFNRAHDLFSYTRRPLAAVAHMLRAGRQVESELSRLEPPTLVMIGARDRYSTVASARAMFELIGSAEKSFRTYERSGHLLPHDEEADLVARDVTGFICGHWGARDR